jgi:ABC-type arginine transport system permease subunit
MDHIEPISSGVRTPIVLKRVDSSVDSNRHSWTRIGLAFAVAAVSDVLAFWLEFVPPMQWALDAATAFGLYLILGRRWALVPGLVAEAIPGMGIFPVWVLVVASILAYDGITKKGKISLAADGAHKLWNHFSKKNR